MTASPQQIFVVSTGRCGSTLLSSMLALHPAVLSLSEVFMAINTRAFVYDRLDGRTFWNLLSRPRKPMSEILTPETCPREFKYDFSRSTSFTQKTLPPILYMALPSISDEPDALFFELETVISARPKAPLGDHYEYLFNWLCRRLGKKLWVERSGASLMFVDALSQLYPNAKFIHLYRDGRDVALSLQSYPPLSLLAQSWNDARKVGVDLLQPPFRIGDSRIVAAAERFLAPLHGVERRLRQRADVEVLGAFWNELILSGLESLSAIAEDRKISLCYENLAQNPRQELAALIGFIDPSLAAEDWLDHAEALIGPARSRRGELSAPELSRLEDACAPALRALGYDANDADGGAGMAQSELAHS